MEKKLLRNLFPFLLPGIFLLLPVIGLSQVVNLQNGLVAYYPFNGNANDASGNNINGVVNGAQLTTDRFGNSDGAYVFNGYSSCIMLPFSQFYNFKPTDAFSLSVWVQHEASANVRSVVVKSPYASFYHNSQWNYGICITDNDIMSVGYHDNFVLKSDMTLNVAEPCWYLLTSTYSDGKWKIYINGKLQKQDLTQTRRILYDGSSAIAFGRKGESDGDYYKGKMDEVRIYNRMLSDEEVQALYTQGTPCPDVAPCDSWLYNSAASSGVKLGDLDISGSAITVEAMINRTQPYSGGLHYAGNIISKHTGSPDCNYLLRPNNAEITTSDGYFSTPDICDIELNKTYHVAMVYNGSKLKFYRDGFLMSEVNCTGTLYNNDWATLIGEIAVYPKTPQEAFIGYINEVRIWNVARTQDEIKAYMNVRLPAPATQTGLQAYYTFDNLLNKQGNSTWNGNILGSAAIKKTNPQCSFVADTCKTPVVVVTAAFTAPDTVCVNTPVSVTNISTNATTHYWNFNMADITRQPVSVNLGNISNQLTKPVFTDIVEANGNYYVFVVNHIPADITRLDFGNNLLNTPTAVRLNLNGNLPTTAEGIQVIYNENKWYAFVVGGNPTNVPSYLVKMEFGTDLTNINPVVTNLGNIGQMDFPTDLYMFKDGGNWYGLTVNITDNTLIRLSFTNSFSNMPTGVNLGTVNGLLSEPTGIFPIKVNDQWHVFVANDEATQGVVRLDFENSLLNTPTGILLNTNVKLSHIRDLYIMSSCDGYSGFVIDGTSNQLLRLDFGSSITSTPVVTSFGNSGNLSFPHSLSKMFRVGGDLYSFITNVDNNTITRVRFSSSTIVSGSVSTLANPAAVTYTTPGKYNINLVVDEGLATQTAFCKSIIVKDCTPPVIAAFSVTDTVCVNTPVNITNISANASTYFWNFCVANINGVPTGSNLGNIGGVISRPVFMDIAQEGASYFGFLVNNTGSLVRLDYGNSLLNTPAATSLGTLNNTITDAEGVQVVKNEGKWYVFIVAGNPNANVSSRIVKVELGTSIINNAPAVVNWGNIGSMYRPMELNMVKENDQWWGVTVNSENSTITRISFGSSFDNVPTGANLGNIGNLNHPGGLFSINDNGNWHVFVTNASSNTITRLDFGNSLQNLPAGINLGNPGGVLQDPRDIYMVKFCDELVGFIPNGPSSNSLIRLNFSSLVAAPAATSLGNIANLSFAHSITPFYRVGADLFSFIPNADNNTLARIQIIGCTNASIPNATVKDPSAITYSAPGNYNINLMVNEGLSTQTSFCRHVTVVGVPEKVPVTDTTICADSIVVLSRFATPNKWNDGSELDSLVIKQSGTYWVNTEFYGCVARDSFVYAMGAIGAVDIGNDTALCRGGQIDIALSVPDAGYEWQDGSTANTYSITDEGKYKVVAKNTFGCTAVDSIQVKIVEWPAVKLMADTTLCGPIAITLRAETLDYTDSIRWSVENAGIIAGNAASPVVTPSLTTRYILTAYNQFCALADSVLVNVLPVPVLALNNDTIICQGKAVPLAVAGADVYEWTIADEITDATAANQQVSPASTTRYYVKGTGTNGCYISDSVLVSVVDLPRVTLMEDTTICATSRIQLRASVLDFRDSLRWTPSTIEGGLSGTTTASPEAQPSVTTVYTLTVYNQFCEVTDAMQVTVNKLPLMKVSNDTLICKGKPLQIWASGADTYQWLPVAGISDAAAANVAVFPETSTTYYVKGTGSNGCFINDSVLVNVVMSKVFDLYPHFITVCEGDSVLLQASGADAYQWLIPGLESRTEPDVTLLPVNPGSYPVIAYDNTCDIRDTLYSVITMNKKPELTIAKSNDIDCVIGEARLTVFGASTYTWLPAATLSGAASYNPVARTDTSTMYHVIAAGINGCVAEDSVLVKVLKNNFNAYPIATAFTPNGDGLNDCFHVNKWGLIKHMELMVYNRLGERIFVTTNPDDCWDGRYKGEPQQPGTFVYIIKAETLCGTVSKTGTVVLIR